MKMKKASKIMALVLAVAMIIALMPVMMVSAATNPAIPSATSPYVAGVPTVTFTVNYTMTAVAGTDQVTLLVTKDTADVTYSDPGTNTQPNNIVYIDQVPYSATGSFTFVADVPATTSTYYVKVGGTDITSPASATTVVTLTQTTYTVSGYVAVAGATATIVGTQYSATADADGKFTITAVPAGTYDLALSKKGALTRTIPIGALSADTEVSVATNKIPLFIGDGNADGLINNDDLLGVKGIFGKANGGSGYDSLYDVNNDNIINNDDLLAVKGSFGKAISSYSTWVK